MLKRATSSRANNLKFKLPPGRNFVPTYRADLRRGLESGRRLLGHKDLNLYFRRYTNALGTQRTQSRLVHRLAFKSHDVEVWLYLIWLILESPSSDQSIHERKRQVAAHVADWLFDLECRRIRFKSRSRIGGNLTIGSLYRKSCTGSSV